MYVDIVISNVFNLNKKNFFFFSWVSKDTWVLTYTWVSKDTWVSANTYVRGALIRIGSQHGERVPNLQSGARLG